MVLSYGEFFSVVLSRLKLWDNLLWGQRMWHSTTQNSIQLRSFVLVIYIYDQCEMGNLANCVTVGSGQVVIGPRKSVLNAGWWETCLNNKKRQNIRWQNNACTDKHSPTFSAHYLLLKWCALKLLYKVFSVMLACSKVCNLLH